MKGRVARAGVLASVITTIALVAEVLVAVPAQAAEVDDRPVTSLPAVTSDAVPAPMPEAQDGAAKAPAIDYAQAPEATADELTKALDPNVKVGSDPASSFDPDKSKIESRSTFKDTYVNPNGTKTAVISQTPLNVKDDGKWVPVNTNVDVTADGEGVVEDHPLDPQFADRASDDGVLTVHHDGYTLAYTLDGAASSPLSHTEKHGAGDEVTYRDVFSDTDLHYTVTNGLVKEELVLAKLPSEARDSWTWHVDGKGLAATTEDDGRRRHDRVPNRGGQGGVRHPPSTDVGLLRREGCP